MFPIFIKFNGYPIASWHIFFVLAFLSSYIYSSGVARRIYPNFYRNIDRFFVGVYISGFFGARTLSMLLEQEYKDLDFKFLPSLFSLGSMTLYGGLLGGYIAGYGLAKIWKLSVLKTSDLLIGSIFLGISIGRVGCFLNGDDYGLPILDQTNPPFWAVKFPVLQDGIYRYPTQLIEASICFLVFLYFHTIYPKLSGSEGRLTFLGVFIYALQRFFLEEYRGDFRGERVLNNLSPAQTFSLVLIIGVVVFSSINRSVTSTQSKDRPLE